MKEVEALDLEDFFEITSTIRLAERLEERKLNRALAQVSYAVTFQQAEKGKRMKFEKYLSKIGLDKDYDVEFLGGWPDQEDEDSGSRPPRSGEPTDEDIREFLEGGGTSWGNIRMEDLQSFKVRNPGFVVLEGGGESPA